MNSTKKIPKILIIDELISSQLAWQSIMRGKVVIVQSFAILPAEKLFELHYKSLDLIAICPILEKSDLDFSPDCVDDIDALPLVKRFKQIAPRLPILTTGYTGGIGNEELMAAGCDFECDKFDILSKICEILGIDSGFLPPLF